MSAAARLTERERVLRALRLRGRHGITAVDFAAPDVYDGGAPITRLADRIRELRADDHWIDKALWRRDRRDVYVLEARPPDPPPAGADPGADDARELFERTVGAPPSLSPYDPVAET